MAYNKRFFDWLARKNAPTMEALAEEMQVHVGTVDKWLYVQRVPLLGHACYIEHRSNGLVLPHHFFDADRVARGLKRWFPN